MSINNKLIYFAQNNLVLARSDQERARIKGSLDHLEKTLMDKLGSKISGFLRFGSFTRNTILPRRYDSKSDVDLMVIMNHSSGQQYSAGTYRKWILDTLMQVYPSSMWKKDFPTVKLELNHIHFDLVPTLKEESAFWGTKTYYIPGSNDSWMETDPNDLNSELSKQNQYYGYNTVRNVIRLMKHWNASRNYIFDSYLMEKDIIGLNFSGDNTYEGFKYALKEIAHYKSNTQQALSNINMYYDRGDYTNELEWVKRLLPGLRDNV